MKWDADFATALPDLGLIAIGEFLDSHAIPVQPSGDAYAAKIDVSTDLFEIFRRKPASDAQLSAYVRGKILWSFRFKCEPTRFEMWEAHRLGVDLSDLHQAAFAHIGGMWKKDGGEYTALPALISQSTSIKPTMGQPASEPEFDVALSFAGEQRAYVEQVASTLRAAGARVFYDYYVDLWGKDLTKELEQVYRYRSKFIVIFISKEYVAKAWPNLERQHALAGRIERMDDSVLPARFDLIELPGLPASVGYRNIEGESPEGLARGILAKLRHSADVNAPTSIQDDAGAGDPRAQRRLTVHEATALRKELKELSEIAERLEASKEEWQRAELDHGWMTGMRQTARRHFQEAAAELSTVEKRQLEIARRLGLIRGTRPLSTGEAESPVSSVCPHCHASTVIIGARLVSGDFRQVVQCSGPTPHLILGDVILGMD